MEAFLVFSPYRPETMVWTLHAQPAWHRREEKPPNPSRHGVSSGRPVVHIQHKHGDDDGQCDENHSEEQVLPDQRYDQRRGRDDLRDEQQEDSERQQHRDAQRDFLAAVRREVEDQDSEAGDEETRDDEVDGVEQGEAADDKIVGDVGVDLVATVVLLGVVGAHGIDNCPLSALPVILEIRLVFRRASSVVMAMLAGPPL